MKASMLALTLLLTSAAASAQQTYKCQDASGRIVYVDRECAVYALREIGPVKDRIMTAPSQAPSEADASAQKRHEAMDACAADARKFCADTKPGGGAIMECLLDHQQEMSEGCYQFLKAKLHPDK